LLGKIICTNMKYVRVARVTCCVLRVVSVTCCMLHMLRVACVGVARVVFVL